VGVDYDYDPGESPVWRYPDGSGQPGCEPTVDIRRIYIASVHIRGVGEIRMGGAAGRADWDAWVKDWVLDYFDANADWVTKKLLRGATNDN
jgi:hypothetical protein